MTFRGVDSAISAIRGMVEDVNDAVKKDYIRTLTAIIKASPVNFRDGGRLRNSWTLSAGSSKGSARGKSAAGSASLRSVARMPKNVLGKTLYFTNPMPYAVVVEYGGYPKPPKMGTNTAAAGQPPTFQRLSNGRGYSRQAPSGMVRINVRKLRQRIRKANR